MSHRHASAARRRRVRLVLAVVAIAVLGGVILFAADSDNGAAPVPAPLPAPSASLPPGARASGVPILLLHGYAAGPGTVDVLARRLVATGRPVLVVPMPQRATAPIQELTDAAAAAARSTQAESVDVVGYSLGGIVGRSLAARPPAGTAVRRLVMVATPNAGVVLADGSGRPEQEHCASDHACGQLAPGSPLLRALDADPAAHGRPGWLTLASDSDGLVRPPAGVALGGARNVVVQQVCPGVVLDHGPVISAPATLGLVVLFLDGRLPPSPSCAAVLAAAR